MNAGLIEAATARYRAGDFAGAAGALEPAAAVQAPAPDVLRILGLCRLRLGQTAAALDLLAQARKLAPDDPWSALHYGVGLQAAGRAAEAIPLFQHCVTALPEDPAPLLNLASAMLATGDAATAVRYARRGRLRAPASPQAHYTLGLAYLAAARWADATACFRKATELAPDFADAWLNLGVAAYRQGAPGAAKQAFRVALRVDPNNVAAAGNLGGLLRLTGEMEASEKLLQATIARHPNAAIPRLNLAADLLQEQRTPEAMALLDGPMPQEPELRQPWLLQRALGLIGLGRVEEARATIAQVGTVPPHLRPLLQWRRVLLALLERAPDRARDEAEAMERAMADAQHALPEHRIMAHYDLAKFWSGQNDTARAMANWTAAHRQMALFQPFSREAHSAFLAASTTHFNAARFAGPRATNRDETPVFVVGMPRSGTTLIEQILSAHPAVHGAGERAALHVAVDALASGFETPDGPARLAALDTTTLDAAAERYLAELHALAPGAERIIDKMPGNFRHLGLVGLMLPGARIISCERDPRDIGMSIFTFRFYGHHNYAHDLSDLGWYIAQQRRLMAHWQSVLPNPMLTVRLRDWVDDFHGTLRRVLAFLDLPYDAACETYYAVERRVRTVSRAQVRQPINARGIGRWRRYAAELEPLITALRAAGERFEDDDGTQAP